MKVVCGGMYRSGGTWQYNVARLIMQYAGLPDLRAGWAHNDESINFIMSGTNSIIKSHTNKPQFYTADIVFTSYRDLRDVVASLNRKFGNEMSLHTAVDAYERFAEFLPFANHIMRYETMMANPKEEIKAIAATLKLDTDIDKIHDEVKEMKFRDQDSAYDPENLLWPGHVTNGAHGSWVGHLPDGVAKQIEHHYKAWMTKNGYITAGSPKAS